MHSSSPRLPTGLLGGLAAAVLLSFLRTLAAGTLRVDEDHLHLGWWALFFVLFGAAAALAARTYLRALDAPPPWPRLLQGALLAHLCAALALPFTSNDVFSNLAYGRLLLRGANPYLLGPAALPLEDPFRAFVGQRWFHTPIVYGPVIAWLNPLAAWVRLVPVGVVLYKLLMLGCTLAALLIGYRACRDGARRGQGGGAAGFLAFAWSPLLAWELSGQAHNDAVMVLGLTAGLAAAAAERRALAVAGLTLAVSAKFAVAPVLLLYLGMVLRQAPLRALVLGLLALALGAALSAPLWSGPEVLRSLRTATGVGEPGRVVRSFLEPLSEVLRLWAPQWRAAVCRGAWLGSLLLVGGAGLISALRVLREGTLAAVVRGSIVVLLTYALTTPTFQPWYVCWMLPLCLFEEDPWWRGLLALYGAATLVVYGVGVSFGSIIAHGLVLQRLWARRSP